MKGVLKIYLVLLLLVGATSLQINAQELVEIPKLSKRVTDLTSTLSSSEINSLESTLAAFEKEKGSQIVVLIVPSTQPEEIEQFSIRVVELWKIGREKVDDGVMLIVAKDDRKLRIEVGYGLEGVIPDAIAKRIINQMIVPEFRNGNFSGGIRTGVSVIMDLIKGEKLPEADQNKYFTKKRNPNGKMMFLVLLFPIYLIIGSFISAKFGNKKGAVINLILFFIIGLLLSRSFQASGIFSGILTLIGYNRKGGGGSGRSSRGGWFVGGGGFSGGGGFGGGGGFSGGGGGFGGGGASGGW